VKSKRPWYDPEGQPRRDPYAVVNISSGIEILGLIIELVGYGILVAP